MYGLGGLEQVEVVKRRRKAKWLEEKKKEKEEEKEKTKDRSVPDGSDNKGFRAFQWSKSSFKTLELLYILKMVTK